MYDQVASQLCSLEPSIIKSQMFGMPTLKKDNKAFVGLSGSDMVFKLDGDAHTQALRLPLSHLFDPMGGRPMKQWVVVPVQHETTWIDFALAALHMVEGSGR